MIKSRFGTLDGLRGVAMMVVVLFHAGIIFGAWVPGFGYLAVDLFFALSGFVLSHAYDNRFVAGMRVAEFLYLRVVRLYPLYFLGLVLGLCVDRINRSTMDAPAASANGHTARKRESHPHETAKNVEPTPDVHRVIDLLIEQNPPPRDRDKTNQPSLARSSRANPEDQVRHSKFKEERKARLAGRAPDIATPPASSVNDQTYV
jgi:hypothetical protein